MFERSVFHYSTPPPINLVWGFTGTPVRLLLTTSSFLHNFIASLLVKSTCYDNYCTQITRKASNNNDDNNNHNNNNNNNNNKLTFIRCSYIKINICYLPPVDQDWEKLCQRSRVWPEATNLRQNYCNFHITWPYLLKLGVPAEKVLLIQRHSSEKNYVQNF